MIERIFFILRAALGSAIRYRRQFGFVALLRLLRQKVATETLASPLSKIDVFEHYRFVTGPDNPSPTADVQSPGSDGVKPAKNSINWVIPPFGRGSGGHLNIFRFVSMLEKLGFECRIIIVGAPQPVSRETAKKQIDEWFFPLKAAVYLGIETAPPCHVIFATSWQTAYQVSRFPATTHRCYFVQDFEPWFYASGSEYGLAEQTYRLGLIGITAGNWLQDKLAHEYGMTTFSVGFSYDTELYSPRPRREPEVRRIFFYARPPTPRRGFELGLLVLAEAVRRMPEVKVIFAGWDVSAYQIPFEHLNAGTLSLEELPDLYSQCDVALILSFSNLSLLPLEVMACGTPVVSNRGPWAEWLLNPTNSRLAESTIDGLADALVSVLSSPDEAKRLRVAGLATARETSWDHEADKMAEIIRHLDVEPADIQVAKL